MGLSHDLHLQGNDYTNASTSFYIANAIFAILNGEFSGMSVNCLDHDTDSV